MYAAAAMKGDSTVPTDAEDEVDFHFVCFVKSHKNGHLYEMDGDRKGPVDTGVLLGPEEDIFAARGLGIVRKFIERENGASLNFSLLVLTPT